MKKIILPLNILLILVILILLLTSIYLFYFNKDVATVNTEEELEVLRDDISNIEAELLTYDQKLPNTDLINEYKSKSTFSVYNANIDKRSFDFDLNINNLSESNNDIDSTNIEKNNSKFFFNNLDIYTGKSNDLTLDTIDTTRIEVIPVLYSSNVFNPNEDILKNIKDSNIYNFNESEYIALSESNLTISEVLKILKYINNDLEKNVVLILEPRYLDTSSEYSLIKDFNELNTLVNIYLIKTYPYTSLYSYLPGPITYTNNFTDIIQYYLFKGLNLDKVYLVINDREYVWPYREIEYVNDFNYLNEELEGNILETNTLLKGNNYQVIDGGENNDTFLISRELNQVIVTQDEEYLNYLKELAFSFGISNIVYGY